MIEKTSYAKTVGRRLAQLERDLSFLDFLSSTGRVQKRRKADSFIRRADDKSPASVVIRRLVGGELKAAEVFLAEYDIFLNMESLRPLPSKKKCGLNDDGRRPRTIIMPGLPEMTPVVCDRRTGTPLFYVTPKSICFLNPIENINDLIVCYSKQKLVSTYHHLD